MRTFARPRLGYIGSGTPATIHHRTAVNAADKLAVPGALTLSHVTESGSTLSNVARNVAVSAYNRWGATNNTNLAATTPTLNQAVRALWGQVAGADGYDVFLSTDAQPKWVGRITEAQRAAGSFIISSVGTVTAGGGASGGVDIGIDGTGLANNVNPFIVNNAATPNAATITPVPCSDYEYADVHVLLSVTDLRSLPTLVLTGYQQVGGSTADWGQFWTQTVSLLTAVQMPLEQTFRVTVAGAYNVVFLVDSLAGQGAACDIWVDLE